MKSKNNINHLELSVNRNKITPIILYNKKYKNVLFKLKTKYAKI